MKEDLLGALDACSRRVWQDPAPSSLHSSQDVSSLLRIYSSPGRQEHESTWPRSADADTATSHPFKAELAVSKLEDSEGS